MSKVNKIRDEMLCIIIDCVNGQEHDSEKVIAKVDELIQAVREETIEKEWKMITEIEARGLSCINRENALALVKTLEIKIE